MMTQGSGIRYSRVVPTTPLPEVFSISPLRISKNRAVFTYLLPHFPEFINLTSLSGWDPWSIRCARLLLLTREKGSKLGSQFLLFPATNYDGFSVSFLIHSVKTVHHTEIQQHSFTIQVYLNYGLDWINAKSKLVLRVKSSLEGISGSARTSPLCLELVAYLWIDLCCNKA